MTATAGPYRTLTVRLQRDSFNTAWGFRLQGGKDFNIPLTIQRVFTGSPAEGELQRGDIIRTIDNNDAGTLTHKQAQDIIKRSGGTVSLVVQRGLIPGADLPKPVLKPGPPRAPVYSPTSPTSPVMPKMATLQVPSVPTTPEAGMFAVRIPSFKTANAPQMGTGFTTAKPPRPRSTDDSIMMNRVATTLDKSLYSPPIQQAPPKPPHFPSTPPVIINDMALRGDMGHAYGKTPKKAHPSMFYKYKSAPQLQTYTAPPLQPQYQQQQPYTLGRVQDSFSNMSMQQQAIEDEVDYSFMQQPVRNRKNAFMKQDSPPPSIKRTGRRPRMRTNKALDYTGWAPGKTPTEQQPRVQAFYPKPATPPVYKPISPLATAPPPVTPPAIHIAPPVMPKPTPPPVQPKPKVHTFPHYQVPSPYQAPPPPSFHAPPTQKVPVPDTGEGTDYTPPWKGTLGKAGKVKVWEAGAPPDRQVHFKANEPVKSQPFSPSSGGAQGTKIEVIHGGSPNEGPHAAHLQYNSPMKMYSTSNVKQSLEGQLEGTGAEGTLRVAGGDEQEPNYAQSHVYRMIHDEPGKKTTVTHEQSRSFKTLTAAYTDEDETGVSEF